MNAKLYWHVHHEVLYEPSADIQERIDYIKAFKPTHEQEIRLRLLQEIKNPPAKLVKALDAYYRARDVIDQASDAYDQAWDNYYNVPAAASSRTADEQRHCAECELALEQAQVARNRACDTRDQASFEYAQLLNACRADLEALHAIECPNCPWNGKTIFP